MGRGWQNGSPSRKRSIRGKDTKDNKESSRRVYLFAQTFEII